jgi:hypothetical protein
LPAEIAATFTTPLVPWGTIASAVTFIALVTVLMIGMMLRIAKETERMEKTRDFDTEAARRAIFYGFSLSFGIASVISGRHPGLGTTLCADSSHVHLAVHSGGERREEFGTV